MSRLCTLLLLSIAASNIAIACTCPTYDAQSLRANFDRIALVEIASFGPEYMGRSPVADKPGVNRSVRVRLVEKFAGSWQSEETLIEGGFEFDCSLHRRVGARVLLSLRNTDQVLSFCNTDSRLPVDLEALRQSGK